MRKINSHNSKKMSIARIVYLIIAALSVPVFVLYFALDWNSVVTNFNFYVDKTIISLFTILASSIVRESLVVIIRVIRPASQRSLTVTSLLNNLVKYSVMIVTVFLILVYFLGYEYITTLVAGLGIVTLVVGLGCQSLISDIIAGISMVFEDQFLVGDVVIIDDWRGKVKEIGLRTTVVEDVSGNIQIINNSQINKVINSSKEFSICICDIGISYAHNLEDVEKIVAKNLPMIEKNIPLIKKDLKYAGVQALADSAVVLRFCALSKEEDKFQVQRDMNRQFKILFDRHNINIPFPQVTLSYAKETSTKLKNIPLKPVKVVNTEALKAEKKEVKKPAAKKPSAKKVETKKTAVKKEVKKPAVKKVAAKKVPGKK